MIKAIALAAAFCFALCAPQTAKAADFTGDVTQTLNGQTLLSGKASVKDGKVRMESSIQGVSQVVISDPAKGRMIMLQPQARMYMETRVNPAKVAPEAVTEDKPSDLGKWRVVGRETIDGWECEKRVFDFKDKSQGEMTGWFALKLDYPIKTVVVSGKETMTVEYRNITQKPLDNQLFEVPQGYQRMNVPDMGQKGAPGAAPGRKPGM